VAAEDSFLGAEVLADFGDSNAAEWERALSRSLWKKGDDLTEG